MSDSNKGIELCCNVLLLCATCFACYSKESRKRKNENIQKEQRAQLEQTQRRLQAVERRQRQRELEDARRNRANNANQVVQISQPPLSTNPSSTNNVAELSESNRVNPEPKDGTSNYPPDYEDVIKSESNKDVIRHMDAIICHEKEVFIDVEVKATDRRKSF